MSHKIHDQIMEDQTHKRRGRDSTEPDRVGRPYLWSHEHASTLRQVQPTCIEDLRQWKAEAVDRRVDQPTLVQHITKSPYGYMYPLLCSTYI